MQRTAQRRCILGIDPGERWLGLARAAHDSPLAFPLGTVDLDAANDGGLAAIRALLEGDAVEAVVVGVPLRADGAEDEQAARFRQFGEQLATPNRRNLPRPERTPHLPRLQPATATALTRQDSTPQRSTREQQRQQRRDSHARAAARILQRWLDEHPPKRP